MGASSGSYRKPEGQSHVCKEMINGISVPGKEICQDQTCSSTAAPSCHKARRVFRAGEQVAQILRLQPPHAKKKRKG